MVQDERPPLTQQLLSFHTYQPVWRHSRSSHRRRISAEKNTGLFVTADEYNAYLDARKRLWPNQKIPRKLGAMEETDDPEEYAKLLREQLINQFGDVPEIDIIVKVEKKWKADEGVPIDEYVDYAHAMFQLFPSDTTLRQFQKALVAQEEVNDLDDE